MLNDHKGLRAHQRFTKQGGHGLHHMFGLLAPLPMCIFCRTLFANTGQAVRHMESFLRMKCCITDNTRQHYQHREKATYECGICHVCFDSLDFFLAHARAHIQGSGAVTVRARRLDITPRPPRRGPLLPRASSLATLARPLRGRAVSRRLARRNTPIETDNAQAPPAPTETNNAREPPAPAETDNAHTRPAPAETNSEPPPDAGRRRSRGASPNIARPHPPELGPRPPLGTYPGLWRRWLEFRGGLRGGTPRPIENETNVSPHRGRQRDGERRAHRPPQEETNIESAAPPSTPNPEGNREQETQGNRSSDARVALGGFAVDPQHGAGESDAHGRALRHIHPAGQALLVEALRLHYTALMSEAAARRKDAGKDRRDGDSQMLALTIQPLGPLGPHMLGALLLAIAKEDIGSGPRAAVQQLARGWSELDQMAAYEKVPHCKMTHNKHNYIAKLVLIMQRGQSYRSETIKAITALEGVAHKVGAPPPSFLEEEAEEWLHALADRKK